MMDQALIFVMLALVITKLADVMTTYCRLASVHQEANPIAQFAMRRFGVAGTCLMVMALSVVIVLLSSQAAVGCGLVGQVFFIVVGFVISGIQLAVAHSNATGHQNCVTRPLLAMFRIVSARL
ncbi:MAG: hypothetical protein EBS30_08325 [Planctomycetes bacterium]|nr:hypothetical protein [Planctomycetota bacterium]